MPDEGEHRSAYRAAALAFRRILYWSVLAAICAVVFVAFCRTSGVGGHGPAKIERVLTGRADRPYAYRALLPLTANLLAPLVPTRAATFAGTLLERVVEEGFFFRRLSGEDYPRQVALILGMMYASLFGFGAVLRRLMADLHYRSAVIELGPPLAVAGIAAFIQFGYIYDFTSLFLFTLGLMLMHRRMWWRYLAVMAVGALNKETMIFLVLIYGVQYVRRLPTRRFLGILVAQLAVYGAVQGALRLAYRENPGQPLQWHLPDQVGWILRLAAGEPVRLALVVAVIVVISVLVIYGWREKPAFLCSSLAVLPLFIVLFLLWGYPAEIRVLLEVYPIVALLMLPPQTLAARAPAAG